ncbi:DUF4112 domain-containing protein [Halobacteriales archaeon QS_8_69_26]|nr:MAG: DUF4112 domain-containing protein [Halobacteriales archaeon QS_8_69_26]
MTDDPDGPDRASEIAVETPTDRERGALRRVRWVSNLMDEAFRIPGTKRHFGLDPVISVLPIGGDAVAAAISAYVLVEAVLLGVPKRVLATMALNIAIDVLGGLLPVVGTVFDLFWKANERNVALLERHIGAR